MASRRGRDKRRQHTYRPVRNVSAFPGRKRCPECGKWCFSSRADAEAAVRIIHPGATVRYYQCTGWWHYTSMSAEQEAAIRAERSILPDEDSYWEPEENAS